jgi:superfamily II DNA or RNA helicase
MTATAFKPGSLVRARDRDWVVLAGTTTDLVRARPAAGREEEETCFLTALEKVESSTFPVPNPKDDSEIGDHASSRLLRDALVLGFRSGTGPFRSFGELACTPRDYQLVPLLMALKLDPVRLLIADDVGIGKTIETCLILKELVARGEIDSFSILCPPIVAEQWRTELLTKFNIHAELVLPSTAARLEKECPGGDIFGHIPFTIVSTDYIKADKRRGTYLDRAPKCVVVDEAHTCAQPGLQVRASGALGQQRHQLLTQLAADGDRHLILVTATPHNGDDHAFRSLLGLLDPKFLNMPEDLAGEENRSHRENLAKNLVQRKRSDIERIFGLNSPFPKLILDEEPYKLSANQVTFLKNVQQFLKQYGKSQGLLSHGGITLLRSIASSPEAGAEALRNLAQSEALDDKSENNSLKPIELSQENFEEAEASLHDESLDGSDIIDTRIFPVPAINEKRIIRQKLFKLAEDAEGLAGEKNDPKLKALIKVVKAMRREGHSPIIFCKYISTANAVANHLQELMRGVKIEAVTGLIAPEQRRERVEKLGREPQRILVATDCLSEGINLQYRFDAVIHYDLAWNPTRQEQREGRVDRFGQTRSKVIASTIYGKNHPVDQRVLFVLTGKKGAIRRSTGVICHVPEISQMIDSFLDASLDYQPELFDEAEIGGSSGIEKIFEDREKRVSYSRSVFAQEPLKTEISTISSALNEAQSATGGPDVVERLIESGLPALGFTFTGESPDPGARQKLLTLRSKGVNMRLRDQLAIPVKDSVVLAFEEHPDADCVLHRTHPTVANLARLLMDESLDNPIAARAKRLGAITTKAVKTLTTLILLRVRFELSTNDKHPPLVAEEARLLAFTGLPSNPTWLNTAEMEKLLASEPTTNTSPMNKLQGVQAILSDLSGITPRLEQEAMDRALSLAESHQNVRSAVPRPGSRRRARVEVKPILPADLLGLTLFFPHHG